MTIRIGTSGWSDDHWEGVLYPAGTSSARRRDLYTGHSTPRRRSGSNACSCAGTSWEISAACCSFSSRRDDARLRYLLQSHDVAYCVLSGAGRPCVLRATAPFVYVRMHGPDPDRLYTVTGTADAMLTRYAHC